MLIWRTDLSAWLSKRKCVALTLSGRSNIDECNNEPRSGTVVRYQLPVLLCERSLDLPSATKADRSGCKNDVVNDHCDDIITIAIFAKDDSNPPMYNILWIARLAREYSGHHHWSASFRWLSISHNVSNTSTATLGQLHRCRSADEWDTTTHALNNTTRQYQFEQKCSTSTKSLLTRNV